MTDVRGHFKTLWSIDQRVLINGERVKAYWRDGDGTPILDVGSLCPRAQYTRKDTPMMPSAPRRRYATDMTDAEWAVVGPLVPPPAATGHPRTLDLRRVLDAIFYLVRTGCQWQMLPHDFPHPSSVRYYFDQWTYTHTLE